MSPKANGVFWIGMLLIAANFWISGQSTAMWVMFTGVTPNSSSTKKSSKTPSSTPPGKGPNPHGFVQ